MHQKDQEDYVQAVLRLYRRLPGTPAWPRRADRQLAAELHRRRVRLDVVEIALRLAVARRNARPAGANPLTPIRSLHYFLPVIDELPSGPPPDGYLDYLRENVPDRTPTIETVTPPKPRQPSRPRPPRQRCLPLDLGACPENDGSS